MMSLMSRGVIFRLLLVVALLGACAAAALSLKPTLGLDLRGGTQFNLETTDGPTAKANAENTDRVVNVLRSRIDALGVAEPSIYRSGSNQIIAELPGAKPTQEQVQILTTAAQLTVREVLGAGTYQEYQKQQAAKEPAKDVEVGDEASGSPSATPSADASDGASDKASDKPDAKNTDSAKDADKGGQNGEEVFPVVPPGADSSAEALQNAQFLRVGPVKIVGSQINKARAEQPQNSTEWVVSIDFNGKAGDMWQKVTADAACARDQGDQYKSMTAIVLDDKIITNPVPESAVGCGVGITGGSTMITGQNSLEEAKSLATLIEGGALPLNIKMLNKEWVGPTLGQEAIKASWQAGLVGLVLTAIFIICIYRLVGLMATFALLCYALISYASLLVLGATLTMPGLAGFVLTIGLAIDANVLVFERAREEYLAYPGGGLKRALMIGFNKAWSAIIDSNVTTILAAVLLFLLGTGPIKGFGITLTIGTLASMFSALVIARIFVELVLSTKGVQKRPRLSGIAHKTKVRQFLDHAQVDLMSKRRLWFAISAAVLIVAIGGIAVKGLNWGLEFTGGRGITYSTTTHISADQAREAVQGAGFDEVTVQSSTENKIVVRAKAISDTEATEIEKALSTVGGDTSKVSDQTMGSSLGSQLKNKAILAFTLAFLAQWLYLGIRFKWTFGIAAVLAMAHDVVLVVGLFAWLGKPIDSIFLAATMTIVGLSVNDTVVVFDRVRETWQGSSPPETFNNLANKACLQTVPRTVNTTMGALFILGALAIFGGDSLRNFSVALLVGLLIGAYSSVFMATPLVTVLQQKWPLERAKKVRKQRDANDAGAVV